MLGFSKGGWVRPRRWKMVRAKQGTGLCTQHPADGAPPPPVSSLFLFHLQSASGFYLSACGARPTFYSNLLVLTCSLLYPLLSIHHHPPFQHSRVRGAPGVVGPPMLRVPFTAQQNEPPKHQLIFQEATSASAATPRHLVDLADPAEDLNSGWESFRDFFQDRLIAISRFRRTLCFLPMPRVSIVRD